MRVVLFGAIALALAGCNQTQTAGRVGPPGPTANASLQELPPIYEPLIDRHRVNESKYQRDLALCRSQAAPQERAAREAAKQAQAGAALALVGDVIGSVPGSNFRQARALGATSNLLHNVGATQAVDGAVKGDAAVNDYALVVNTCLRHRGYALLR